MKGSIRQRSKGSWEICIDVGRDPATGKRHQHWHTIRGTKRDAERKLRELLHALDTGGYVKPARQTLGGYLEWWLENYAMVNTSQRTIEGYQMIIERHVIPALGAIPLAQLQPQHLQSYYAQKLRQGRLDGKGALSRQTILHHHRLLHEALDHAVKQGILARNITEAVVLSGPERKEKVVLRREDADKLLEAIKKSLYYVLFYTAFYTGLRRSELLGLRWADIELDFACLFVVRSLHRLHNRQFVIRPTKSHRSDRPVNLPPSLALLLRQHKADQQGQRILLGKTLTEGDMVFCHPDGSPLDPDVVSHTFAKLVRKADLPHIRFHDLRHAHATFLIKEGLSVKMVSERLGHADPATTLKIYSHVLPGEQREAAERFDRLFGDRC